MKLYRDTESGRLVTLATLKEEYDMLKAECETEAETFEDYLENCMTYNNGTLDAFETKPRAVLDYLVTSIEDFGFELDRLSTYGQQAYREIFGLVKALTEECRLCNCTKK